MNNQDHINIYHFINYERSDLIFYINSLMKFNVTVCFDLEDSVQDIFLPEYNSALKQKARAKIKEIFQLKNFPGIGSGIRLNSFPTNEINSDLEFLSELKELTHINSILLPKTESREEVESLLKALDKFEVKIQEIIPIIETQNGFNNLSSIIANRNEMLKRIAFGHCDFNHDKNIFPFFHQNSKEYWEWIKEIVSITEPAGIEIINSPFLKLNDDKSYNSMLSKLTHFCKGSFGQITLTYRQVELCEIFRFQKRQLNGFNKNLSVTEISDYAQEIIRDYESHNMKKGFSVTEANKTLISPHEYISAKKYLSRV